MPYAPNILVVDDDESMRAGCLQALTQEGYRAKAVEDGTRGLALLQKESFDAIILDLKMPGLPGMDVLKQIKKDDPGAVVIVVTGYGTIDIAVEAMREGAFDFLTKPFTPESLCAIVEKAVESRRHLLEKVCLKVPDDAPGGREMMIGRSPAMMKIAALIKKIAPSNATVLIYGETGVGKELVARTIHRLSSRYDKPFITVDCGTLVETLFESEMFGHVKGAFTGATETTRGKFEMADGGTIFLDEIANISIKMQARLLRVIQEKEISKVGSSDKKRVNVRITSATNRDLPKEIQEGRFREDLFYRLNVVPVHLPALRNRREDIPILAQYFLKLSCEKNKTPMQKFSEEAMRFLENHDWPGNIRELKNAIERAVITSEGNVIHSSDFSYDGSVPDADVRDSGGGSLAMLEKEEILRALCKFNGNKSKAAQHLGINRKTLREKMHRYQIDG